MGEGEVKLVFKEPLSEFQRLNGEEHVIEELNCMWKKARLTALRGFEKKKVQNIIQLKLANLKIYTI